MKRSAGILPYKYIDNDLYVYLEHPGGPYYKGINKWSICKGEFDNELAIDAAIREFKEETGKTVKKEELEYLCSYKVSNNKLVILYIINIDINPEEMTSNTFEIEFPKGSGKKVEFPEMDKAEWFKIEDAYDIIFPSQKKFITRLKQKKKQ